MSDNNERYVADGDDFELVSPEEEEKPAKDEILSALEEVTKEAVEKKWIPYVGPKGGEGWQNTQNPDDIRYQTEAPGEVSAGYDEDHWTRDERVVGESDSDMGYVSSEEGPSLNVTTADEAQSLSEAGASEGASSRHMHVATWRTEDGEVSHRAFVTNYGPDMERNETGEKPYLGERAIAADSFLRNIGFGENVPKHFLNRQQRYLAVESTPGKEARNAPDEWTDKIDEEEAKDFAAAVMLMGNSDLHSKNVLVDEDGTFRAVDLDKSGGDFVNGPTRFKRRGRDSIIYSLRDMGINIDKGELGKRTEKLANQIDVDEVTSDVPNSVWSEKNRHRFRDNIRNNIEAAREGRLL